MPQVHHDSALIIKHPRQSNPNLPPAPPTPRLLPTALAKKPLQPQILGIKPPTPPLSGRRLSGDYNSANLFMPVIRSGAQTPVAQRPPNPGLFRIPSAGQEQRRLMDGHIRPQRLI